MKTQIKITGQINGNFTLLRSLHRYEKKENLPFNNFLLYYETRKDAREDIREACRNLKDAEPGYQENEKEKNNGWLHYDASYAEIID